MRDAGLCISPAVRAGCLPQARETICPFPFALGETQGLHDHPRHRVKRDTALKIVATEPFRLSRKPLHQAKGQGRALSHALKGPKVARTLRGPLKDPQGGIGPHTLSGTKVTVLIAVECSDASQTLHLWDAGLGLSVGMGLGFRARARSLHD